MKKVAVIMGSASDLPVVEKAIATLKEYGVPHEVHVYSAHRTPAEARLFAENAQANGFGAIIAAAGKAAHLAGALAAATVLPVVGRSNPRTWTAWTRYFPRCRCPRAFQSPRWRSTAR